MSLKAKFSILLAGLFLGLLLVNVSTISFVVFPSFEELETRETKKNMGRVIDILESDIKDMDSFAYDWAAWDDTYIYIKDRNQAYEDANYIPEYSAAQNHDLYYIWDSKGQPILNKALNEEGTAYVTFDDFPEEGLPETHPFLTMNSADSKLSGLIQTRRGPMIIAARPVIDSNLKGPINGVLAMGRYLDNAVIKDITQRSRLKLNIWSLKGELSLNIPKEAPRNIKVGNSEIVLAPDKKTIYNYSSYADIFGNPVILLQVAMLRDIVKQGKSTVSYGVGMSAISGGVIFVILLFILQRYIIFPLSHLGQSIVRLGKREDVSDQLPLDRSDELGMIARSILQVNEERNNAEMILIKKNQELEKASLAKSEFLSRMSHELRTPLNAILGFTQLLEMNAQSKMSDTEKKNLGMVFSAGKHLLELINEVLDLSKIESGNMKLSIDTVDMAPIVDNVISFSKSLAGEKGISLEYQKIPEDCCFIKADPLRFKQVVLNLISNAIKYNIPNGSVIVSFEMKDNMRRLGIRDTGHGIAEDKKDKLFKPFERFDVDADNIEGTGIGLAISKQLIGLMNGTVGFESEEGEGSYFYIDIPASVKAPLPIQVEEEIDSKQPSLTGNIKKILYIEDFPANVELVRQILNCRKEIILLSASNALAGIEIAKSETPDLILMDIHMPGMDGLTAFKKLQTMNETKGIPVLALTANAMEVDINKAFDIGFKGYITKPIDAPKFLNEIDEVFA
jgi:signal transduction histidine kinase/CheY-like chemotaxis protein